jgi:hypothetical protein
VWHEAHGARWVRCDRARRKAQERMVQGGSVPSGQTTAPMGALPLEEGITDMKNTVVCNIILPPFLIIKCFGI